MLTVDLLNTLQALIVPAIVCMGGAIAKYLRDISSELGGIKTAIAVTTKRVDGHAEVLMIHDGRIRSLETKRPR